MNFFPQSVKMPRILSADAATLATSDLIEEFKNPVPAETLASLNDTHHSALQILVEIFNIIPKYIEKNNRQT